MNWKKLIAVLVFAAVFGSPVFAENFVYPQGAVEVSNTDESGWAVDGPDKSYALYVYPNGYTVYDLRSNYNLTQLYISTFSGIGCYDLYCDCVKGAYSRQALYLWYSADRRTFSAANEFPDGILSCSWDVQSFDIDWKNVRYVKLGRLSGGSARGDPAVDVFYFGTDSKRATDKTTILPVGLELNFLQKEAKSIFSLVLLALILLFLYSIFWHERNKQVKRRKKK